MIALSPGTSPPPVRMPMRCFAMTTPYGAARTGARRAPPPIVGRLLVVNDFAAVAAATPHLKSDERKQVGGGEPVASAPIGVLGPGSGLGVGGLVMMAGQWVPVSGEGGHATMAPASARESAVLD